MSINRVVRENRQPIIAAVSLVGVVVLLTFLSEYFLTTNNMFNIGKQASINLIIGLGMTVVIISAGIDLSVGSLLALTISVSAVLSVVHGMNIVLATSIAVVLTVLAGVLNGVIIQFGKVPAFIATLGMMGVGRGVVLLISRGNPSMSFPKSFLWIADGTILGIPFPIFLSLIMVALTAGMLKYTRFGRAVYAIGGNEEAARLSGINIPAVRVATYGICGFCCALAGIIFAARVGAAPPSAGVGYELNAIAAVIIGGTALNGGKGNVLGTVVGALLMAVISNGLNIIDVDPYWQSIVIGLIIVFAVMMSNLRSAAT
ncbi:ABC transporter permease [Frigidibacter sp. ROC022]|uniref:ABC transporter permease n=1 Tax=Frigidibacter sp. ROC022 TaxID=2971796 RepID=UPI00215B4CCD|nr:ABC transporter permease [Frigidibacter sp. ROC022]MCR8725798.1 ABC transporter permease [Frigidibacter sp. ROC022]